jgi:UDPglucose 6-dehydrogenase
MGATLKIAVIGSWHQSSVVSACFADMGYQVSGICDDPNIATALNDGRAPLYEPGLDELIHTNLAAGRLAYTTSYAQGLSGVDFGFLCIDTPVGPRDDSDLRPIYAAVDQIATRADGPFILCVSAQVPIGTCDQLAKQLAGTTRYSIPVVYVPEFLRLGTALQTFREADRFVIGSEDRQLAERVARLYQPLERPMYITSRRSAEMAKHASNAFLATSISFINQIADLCDVTGADVTEVASIMKLDSRIGTRAFLSAGVGYAGGTLGREIRALQQLGERYGLATGLLDSVAATNDLRVPRIFQRVRELDSSLMGSRIAMFGLTYKPGTSTLRRSAALELVERLAGEGATVAAYDPLVRPADADVAGLELCGDALSASRGARALILVGPWIGSLLDFRTCAASMQRPVLVDTGNYLSPDAMAEAGFTYIGVGRGSANGS